MIRIQLSVRNLLVIAGVLVGLWVLAKVWSVVLLAGVALLLAAALLPFVEWLRQRIHNRAAAVLVVVLVLLAALALITFIIVPPMVAQGQQLWEQAPELQARAARLAVERGQPDLAAQIATFQWRQVGGQASSRLLDTGSAVLGVVIALVTTFFLTAYFMLDARRLQQFLYFSTPRDWHPHIRALLPALQRVVGGYIRGQAITSGAIFLFTFVLLTVLGVPNAVALAAIAAIADLIPLVGVFILIAVVALPALTVSLTTAIIVVGAMLLYQQLEDRVLIPRVYGATLRLPTIAVVLALLVGAELLGIIGALVALPVAAGIRVTVEYFAAARHHSPTAAAAQATPDDEPFAPNKGAAAVASTNTNHTHHAVPGTGS